MAKSKKVKLENIDPGKTRLCPSKDEAVRQTQDLQKKIYDLLYLMFAHNRHSVLIILHGIDTAGKDGVVRLLFNSANPQGIKVYSFKKPTPEESRHDFIWRCHLHTPESGLTAIFNRSYYEEVTTVMVHPELLDVQNLPQEIRNRSDFFPRRYQRINEFEQLLTDRGTVVFKFFLHISKREQKSRIEARLKNRDRNWKFSIDDVKERKHWDSYQSVFQKMIESTSTLHCPWHVIPADNKWYRDYLVTKTIFERLKKLEMNFPKTNAKISKIRAVL